MKTNKLLQLLKDNARAEGPAAIRAEETDGVVDIYVYDVIDAWWGANASGLVSALKAAEGKDIRLHINSPGGDVFEARAMAAAITAHAGKVTAHIDGMAASAATYLALSANEVRMSDGALFMVHNSWTLAYGNRTELRATADLLEKIDGTISADYQRKTGASAEQVGEWMDAETWFTAQEALDAGFVDVIDASSKGAQDSAARWNLSAYANAPKPQKPAAPEAEPAAVAAALQANRNRMRLLQI